MKPTLKRWRKIRPATHRSYGEKRNRDERKKQQEALDERDTKQD